MRTLQFLNDALVEVHTDVSEMIQEAAGDKPEQQLDTLCRLVQNILDALPHSVASAAISNTFPGIQLL